MNGEMGLVCGAVRLGLRLGLRLDLGVDNGWMSGCTVLEVTKGTYLLTL